MLRILIIEDDSETANYIRRGLRKVGHKVVHTSDGHDGLGQATKFDYDAVVIDRMLPGLDGLTIVKMMRQQGVVTPVLLLTALDGIDDRVEGLNAGGDDYLTKPFANAELIARLNALARRTPSTFGGTVLRVGDLKINLVSRRVKRGAKSIFLSPREFCVMEYLVRNVDRVVTRTMLLEKVWNFHFDPKTKIVETHISRLRAKIDGGFKVKLVHTVRGAGYVIRPPT